MIRSLGSATSHHRKKKKRLASVPITIPVVEALESSGELVKPQSSKHLRHRALTEDEFLGVLCHIANTTDNFDNHSSSPTTEYFDDQTSSPTAESLDHHQISNPALPLEHSIEPIHAEVVPRLPKTSLTRILFPHFPSPTFFTRKKSSRCMCCRASSPSIINTTQPEFSLPSYPPRQHRVGDCSEKTARFAKNTKPGTPEGALIKRPSRINSKVVILDDVSKGSKITTTALTETKRIDIKKRGRTLQRLSSLDDFLRTLRKERRRKHFALTAEEFQQRIIPELVLP
jgi:hypothetical protein